MLTIRQRKLDARAHRQESLHGVTTEKTLIKTPQPKNFPVNEIIKLGAPLSKELKKEMPLVKKILIKSPVVTEAIKRGPGRPRKIESEKISKVEKRLTGKKTVKSKGKR
jgi:hypothetical protein